MGTVKHASVVILLSACGAEPACEPVEVVALEPSDCTAQDLDGDGVSPCDPSALDCDDADALRFPGADETCNNRVVDDCQGSIDQAVESCAKTGQRPHTSADRSITNAQTSEGFGQVLAEAGDLNGDGHEDLIVQNSTYTFLYYAPLDIDDASEADNRWPTPRWPAGDVSGDGLADVLVLAPGSNARVSAGGSATLYGGGAGSDLTVPYLTILGVEADLALGASGGAVGDLDADGAGDVLLQSGSTGALYLFPGGAPGVTWSDEAAARLTGGPTGAVVLASGDLDADGAGDVLISDGDGRAWLLPGSAIAGESALGDAAIATFQAPDPDSSGGFGASVTVADLDADGVLDITLAAATEDRGAVYLWLGPITAAQGADTASGVLRGTADAPGLGAAVSAGDFDGDGHADLAVGGLDSARVFTTAWSGRATAEDASFSVMADRGAVTLGTSLLLSADLNGDTLADLLVADPDADRGALYLFTGRSY